MTVHLERARSRRGITWLTIVGVVLLPVVIGGILVAALYNPVERLDSMTAAIVNNDVPVTINDQYVPLGRQLTAGLVKGTDDSSNLTWVVSNTDDAAAGLADGTYQAVVTIPENFSAAATSTAPGGTPEQATIDVATPADAKIVDDAITAQVTSTAASVMGKTLSTTYLENVFLGFTTLGDKLGEAATGAHKLADGAQAAADGAAAIPSGAAQLASGTRDLATGATSLGSGLDTIATQTHGAADGATQLANGVRAGATTLQQSGLVPDQLTTLASGAASTAATAATQTGTAAATIAALSGQCLASGAAPAFCDQLAAASTTTSTAAQTAGGAATQSAYVSGGLAQFDTQATATLVGQFNTIATNVDSLATGINQLADQGITPSANGARDLAAGANQIAGGIDSLGAGATTLADGLTTLASGTNDLATGLDQAVAQVPSYTDSQSQNLAAVVADPVTTSGIGSSLFGASAIPLLAVLALWFGGLATFVALQAATRRALSSRRASVTLALRGLAPAAAIGAAQGLLVAGVVQLAASYDWGTWWAFALVCVVAGVAFAAVNQALVAVLGGAGRWISALIGVLAVAAGIVSTVPGAISGLAALMPTAPAYNAMLAALTSATGLGAGLAGLVIWTVLATIATTLAVARRRTLSTKALLTASAAPA